MYLTYAEYQAMGGTLEESVYNKYEFRAETIIDWYTFNRLHGETDIPERVRKCMFMLIDLLYQQDKAMGGDGSGSGSGGASQIASQSNDGVSVSYSIMSTEDLIKYRQKELDDIVGRTLQGVMNSIGHRLLYRGIYPGEELK